jgi:hypothetical protein
MAIVAQLIGTKGTVQMQSGVRADAVQLPPSSVQDVAAAGFVDLTVDAELYLFHNLSTSQLVHIRLNKDTDSTAASAGDGQSIKVDAGETFAFGLAADLDASAYKLSVV